MKLQEGIIIAEQYLLLRQLGHGSFGEVWLAHHQLADIDVAIKFYGTYDMRGLDEFRNEFKLAYQLHHPNLLNINHFDIQDNCPFLVMPYCANGSVSSSAGRMSEQELWKFVVDVSNGLAYLHSQHPPIIHQDIKPDNILVTADGRYVISDFGISRSLRTRMSKTINQGSSGTIAYMGPERFSEQPVIVLASDVWAFGMTLYELMNGDILWEGMGGCVQLNGARIPTLQKSYSKALVDLVMSCLSKETWDRPTAEQINDYAQAYIQRRPLPALRLQDKVRVEPIPQVLNRHVETPMGGSAQVAAEIHLAAEHPSVVKSPRLERPSVVKASETANHDSFLSTFLPSDINAKRLLSVSVSIVLALLLGWGGYTYFSHITEERQFVSCSSKADYEQFIRDYPKSDYVETARKRIADLTPNPVVTTQPPTMGETPAMEHEETPAATPRRATDSYNRNRSTAVPSATVRQPSQGNNATAVSYEETVFRRCVTAKDYHNYLKRYPNGRYREQAAQMLETLINSQGSNDIPTNRVIERPPGGRRGGRLGRTPRQTGRHFR